MFTDAFHKTILKFISVYAIRLFYPIGTLMFFAKKSCPKTLLRFETAFNANKETKNQMDGISSGVEGSRTNELVQKPGFMRTLR